MTEILSPIVVKKIAKTLKKETGISHSKALDKVVKEMGFRDWNVYMAVWCEKNSHVLEQNISNYRKILKEYL